MFYFIISLFLGVLPDILYYYLYLKEIKGIKTKKILFFILLCISYLLCVVLIPIQFYLYIISDLLIYFILKYLYKSQINDIFVVITLELYMIIISAISFIIFKNYYIAFVIYRVLMFVPLIFKNKLRKIYNSYNKLWNRHNYKNKLKSITVRNISLVILNVLIVSMYFILLYITNVA